MYYGLYYFSCFVEGFATPAQDNGNTSYALDVNLVISTARAHHHLSDVHPIYMPVSIAHLIARGEETKGSSRECVDYTTTEIKGCVQHKRSVEMETRGGREE